MWPRSPISATAELLLRIRLNELFTLDDNLKGTRGHSWKLAKFQCTLVEMFNYKVTKITVEASSIYNAVDIENEISATNLFMKQCHLPNTIIRTKCHQVQ